MVVTLLGCLVPFLCGLLIGISCLLLVLVRAMLLGGVSYLELLILYEKWAGERLVIESAVPFANRVGRPISVSAVPVGPGIDIGRSCRFFWESCSLSCPVTWWFDSVFALSHWCKSLQASSFGMGEVWAWAYFSA